MHLHVEDEQLLAVHVVSKSTGTGIYGGAMYTYILQISKRLPLVEN